MRRCFIKFTKRLLCPIMGLKHRIKNHDGYFYIGKACKFVNPQSIYLSRNVSVMPYNMLICLNRSATIEIGKNTQIGMFSRIGALNNVYIGNDVLMGPHIFIADYNHEYRNIEEPVMDQGNHVTVTEKFPGGGIKIGDETWLGTNVVITGSVEIGKHCVIGANSVVTKDIPDYCVAAGIPCRVIKRYNFQSNKWETVESSQG